MPVHDWSKVDDGVFHAFHSSWIAHLQGAFNSGVLPDDHFALSERAPSPDASYRALRRTLEIRHTSDHRLVAMIEIASPGDKGRRASVDGFAAKVESAIRNGVHVLLVDLFRPGKYDPHGLHGAVWEYLDSQSDEPLADRPLCLASYLASQTPEGYIEHLGFGDRLPEMPLFLEYRAYVMAPLETTYERAYSGMPRIHREILEAE